MLELLNFDRIEEILILIVPGFVSLKMWMLVNPTARLKLSDYVLDIVVYSALNFVALSWLLHITVSSPIAIRVIVGLGVLVLVPAAWPLLLRAILNRRFLRGRIVHPIPLPWDHFFLTVDACFVLVHLKNGQLLGGRYTGDSFASSYPERQELYLSEVWRVDGRGRFQSKVDATRGVLVNQEMIAYLEFYDEGEASDGKPQVLGASRDEDQRAG